MGLRWLSGKGPVFDMSAALPWLPQLPDSPDRVLADNSRPLGSVSVVLHQHGEKPRTVRLVIGRQFVEVRGNRLHGVFDRRELLDWLADPHSVLQADDVTWHVRQGQVELTLMDGTLRGCVSAETIGQVRRGTMTLEERE